MADKTNEILKRRTFAIISHPDAGKTTLTEKFLLYGGAINLAGSVKGKATARHAVSDWMEIEKERGISVTSSVLQFNYDGYCINILDTPGHQDFSEDTYRTLMAADSAVMVIDGIQGCRGPDQKAVQGLRHAPYPDFYLYQQDGPRRQRIPSSFWTRSRTSLASPPARSTGPSAPVRHFKGVYDRNTKKITAFSDTEKGTKEGRDARAVLCDSAELDEILRSRARRISSWMISSFWTAPALSLIRSWSAREIYLRYSSVPL